MLLAERKTLAGSMRLGTSMLRVGAHKQWERFCETPARKLDDVPSSPAMYTPQWLTAVLCGNVPGARVESMTLGRTSSGATDRQALDIVYNEAGKNAGLPASLFCKYSNSLQQRLWLGNSELMQHEVEFYRSVRHELDIESPKAYHVAYHPRGWQSVVLLEDLSATKGATFCAPTTAMTFERMTAVLGELAKLHGKFWNSRRLDAEFTWLPTPFALFSRFCETFAFKSQVMLGMGRAGAVMPAQLKGRGEDLWVAYSRSCACSDKGSRTLLHGDPHVGNCYVTARGDMGINDWQVVMKGNWAWDVAYLMVTALPIESRRLWERDLLKSYLDRRRAAGGEDMPLDDAWLDYRRHTLHALMGWLVTIGASGVQPEGQQKDDVSLAVIERACAAVIDLDSFGSLGV